MGDRIIFVFGSNREGRHGKGAALEALRKYGARYGQPEGLQGNSYGIITKELRKNFKAVTLEEVRMGIHRFLLFAQDHPNWRFIVSAIGCGLAGFTTEEIAPLFQNSSSNIEFPESFKVVLAREED